MPLDARRPVTYAHRRNRKRQREDGCYLVPSTAPAPQLPVDDNISRLEMSRRMLKRSRPSTSFPDHQLTASSSISSEKSGTLPKSKRSDPSSTSTKTTSKLKPTKRTKYKTRSMKQKENSAPSHTQEKYRGLLSANLQPTPIAQRRTTRVISKAPDIQRPLHVPKDREKVQKTQALLLASPFASKHSSPTAHISHVENPPLNRKHTSAQQLKSRRTMPDAHHNSNFPHRTNEIKANKRTYISHLDFQPPTPIIPTIPKRSQTIANVNGCPDLPWDIDLNSIARVSSLAPVDFNRPPSQSPSFQFNTEDIEGMSFGRDIQGISTPIRKRKPKRTLNRDTTMVSAQILPISALPSSLPPATPHPLDQSVVVQNQYSPWVTDSLISPPTIFRNPVSPIDDSNDPDYNAFTKGGKVTQEVTHVDYQPEEMENKEGVFDNLVDSLCLGSAFGLRACDATQSSITQSPPVTTNNTNDIVTSKPSLMSAIPAPAMGSMNSNVVCPVTENQANLPSHDPDQTTATNSSSSLQAYINAIPTPLMSPASRDLPSNSKTMVAPDTVSAVFAPPSSSPDPLDLFKYDWLNDPPPSVSRRRKLRMKKRTRFFGLRESPPEEIGDDELNMF